VVYLEQFDYIPLLTEAAGAVVVIHNQTVMPFPDQNAISLTANTLVNIGINKVNILCTDSSFHQFKVTNYW